MKSKHLTGLLGKVLLLASLGACQSSALHGPVLQRGLQAGPVDVRAQADWYQQLAPELQAYYAPAQGLHGVALFERLSEIVQRAESLDYLTATSFLYTVADQVQQGKESAVHAAYSNILVRGDGPSGHKYKEEGDANGDGKRGDSINCEHTWPQSFFDKTGPMRTDLHHLFPTLSTPNSQRGQHAFGLAKEGKVVYQLNSGAKLIALAGPYSVFEPPDIQKGNTSRALLYFYLRYHKASIREGDYQGQYFLIDRLPMFQSWLKQDPVDTNERLRHEKIARRQGNRNPFIDIPDLFELIGPETFATSERLQSH